MVALRNHNVSASITFFVVDGNDASAVGALGFRLLRLEERSHTFFFYIFEVSDEACAIPFNVAFLYPLEVFARQVRAFATGVDLVFGEFFAAPFDIAVFASCAAACAMADFSFLFGDAVGL
jgi:hypothetical protein